MCNFVPSSAPVAFIHFLLIRIMKIFKRISLFSILFFFSFSILAQENPDILPEELEQHVSYLASDDLQGRYPGTEGDRLSAEYIAGEYDKAGIKRLAENGFQYFEVVVSAEAGEKNMLDAGDVSATLNKDFTPLSFSKNTILFAPVVFAGYGFDIKTDSLEWNDYAGVDVNDKWVVILRGEPGDEEADSPFAADAGLREKVIVAKDKGAGGVIFVSGPSFDKDDMLMRMFYDKTTADAGIPVFHAKRSFVDKMLDTAVGELEEKITGVMAPASFECDVLLNGRSDVVHQKVKTMNVVGMVEGTDPILKDEIVVIGAHYDHLGMGGTGSGSREPDVIAVHNGADDNASGVAGIIEIAEKLALNKENRRSLVVVAFGAEEMGLIGSNYFVNNPLIDLDKVVAMFNFDMIGRLKEDKSIAIGGTGTSTQSEEILNSMLEGSELSASYSREGFGPSDHAAFYGENIPVFFISTGAHQDYHTPKDDIEFIDFAGQKKVSDFSYELIAAVDARDEALTFQEAGNRKSSRQGYRFKVTLGIVPDFTSSDNNGLGVGGVRSGGPAEKAGMLKGDVIIALDGMEVTNIYDYMARLKKLEAGEIITVDVMREGKKLVLLVQL